MLNENQYDMAFPTATQVCKDIRARNTNNCTDWCPLCWSMHGGPGTGKSHVIKIRKTYLFEQVLKSKITEDFQFVALQAVMADLLGRDAIHHALKLPVFGRDRNAISAEVKTQHEVAKHMLEWRWLIIDEIRMVSPELLADVDCKLRALSRGSSPFEQINTVSNVILVA